MHGYAAPASVTVPPSRARSALKDAPGSPPVSASHRDGAGLKRVSNNGIRLMASGYG
jgi:hypothetical protein